MRNELRLVCPLSTFISVDLKKAISEIIKCTYASLAEGGVVYTKATPTFMTGYFERKELETIFFS